MKLVYVPEAARMVIRRVRVGLFGWQEYSGDDEGICSEIISACFDEKKQYFRTSTGHFSEFYCRDFGWSAESLVSLGYATEVADTIDYALDIFEKAGRVRQSISPSGIPFTFPAVYSPDALAFLIHAMASLSPQDAAQIVKRHRAFLDKEVARYARIVIDPDVGIVKKSIHFSSMKDYSIRHSSCYDNSVTGMLSRDLDTLGIRNPFKRFDYAAILKFNFWNGDYFFDDMSWRADVCGDANVMPFWCGVITDKLLLKKALSSVRKAGLDRPIPLKYTQKKSRGQMMISYERLAGDYERDSAWAHMGLMFIKNVATINKSLARRYLRQYRDNILKHKNFLEVYDSKGMPFKTWLYHADEGMLWCANYLALKKELGI